MKTLLNILTAPKTRSFAMIFFLVLVSLLLISAINYKSDAYIGKIEVEIESLHSGHSMIIGEEIEKYLIKNTEEEILARKVSNIDTRNIENVLLHHDNISNAEVYVDVHNVLRCKIEHKVPVFRVMNIDGSYYMSNKGERIPLSNHYTARAIVLSGSVPTYAQVLDESDHKRVEDILLLYNKIEADDFFLKLIDHVHVKRNGDFIIIPVLGDFEIHIGNTDLLDDKLVRLKTFYSEVMKHESWKKYKYIDLRFKDQLIAKKK